MRRIRQADGSYRYEELWSNAVSTASTEKRKDESFESQQDSDNKEDA